MPKRRWRPPEGATHGVCPACEQWVPLTKKGYVQQHNYVTRGGRVIGLWPTTEVGEVVRCVAGTGRDPLVHTCTPPVLHRPDQLAADWTCRCGLKWRPVRVGDTVQWSLV